MTRRNDDIARAFSEGATEGKGSNMFIERNTIYSWGTHFAIAIRLEGREIDYLFNSKGYSHSTDRHKNLVRRYLKGVVLEIMDCRCDKSGEQYKDNLDELQKAKKRLTRIRTEYSESVCKERIEYLKSQNIILAKLAVTQKLEMANGKPLKKCVVCGNNI